MPDEIKVIVIKQADRGNYLLRYIDPLTGKRQFKSAETASKKDAMKAAGKWQAELQEGRYRVPSKITWDEFRERYEDEILPGLAPTTDKKVSGVFNAVEKHLKLNRLRDLNADRLSGLQRKLREAGLAESTIKGHMAHLRAALQWAANVGMLPAVPNIQMPKRAKSSSQATPMKGRPITGEEFERMLDAIEKGVFPKPKKDPRRKLTEAVRASRAERRPAIIESWRHYLRGLWWSGLRLAESLELSWDDDTKLCVDLSGKRPMLRIPGELEKGNKDRLLPIAPEFAEFLLATPEGERSGYVFNPSSQVSRAPRLAEGQVGRLVTAIGAAAGVRVRGMEGAEDAKFASAHDLRRSFGERWAPMVMPQTLMVLMRHESIETTMRYYVGRNAQTTADVLWEAYARKNSGATGGNTGGNTAQKHTEQPSDQSSETVAQ